MLKIKIYGEVPDYRVLKTFCFCSDFHNVDSYGNSEEVWSRDWTELYMSSREIKNFWFDIDLEKPENKTIFVINASNSEIANRIAYFLAKETKGEIFDMDNVSISSESLLDKMGDFDFKKHLELADKSIWRLSSKENPYPNQK